MSKKNRRKMLAFVPDTTDVDLDNAVAVVEPEEGTIETIEEVAYMCTACFDVLTAEELKGNTNDCPSCKETDCIMER